MKNSRRIDAAARPNSDRNVRDQMFADRFLQQIIQLFFRLLQAAASNFTWRPPIRAESRFSIDPFQQVSRRKLLDALDHRIRSRNVVQPKKTIESIDIDLPLNCRMFEDGFDFRSKEQFGSRATEVKRLDADPVPREDQTLFGLGPKREREHSSQAGKAPDIPFAKCMQYDLGVAGGNESVAGRAKLLAQ